MASKQCQDISGWPGEQVRCVRLCEPGRTFHDGYHQFPVKGMNKEEDVEAIVKLILEAMKLNAAHQDSLIKEIEKALKAHMAPAADPEQGPRKKKQREPEEVKVPASAEKSMREAEKEMARVDGLGSGTTGSKTEDKPILVQDVTIEMLREMATKYSKAFGMEKLLALNLKLGGAKKLSGVEPKMYGAIYGHMDAELTKATESPLNGAEKPKINGAIVITIEQVREKAAAFLTTQGQPALLALLKAFGAAKISELAKEKYPAFVEAMVNA